MAVIKFVNESYQDNGCYERELAYISNHNKMFGSYIQRNGLYGGDPHIMADQLNNVDRYYNCRSGNRLFHIVISFDFFDEDWVDYEIANRIIRDTLFLSGLDYYLYAYAFHGNTSYVHCHIIIQSVCYLSGLKLDLNLEMQRMIAQNLYQQMRNILNEYKKRKINEVEKYGDSFPYTREWVYGLKVKFPVITYGKAE